MKKIISLLLAFAMVLSLSAVTGFAAGDFVKADDFQLGKTLQPHEIALVVCSEDMDGSGDGRVRRLNDALIEYWDLPAAPVGYNYYNVTLTARIYYDGLNEEKAFPSGGYLILTLGKSETSGGSLYPYSNNIWSSDFVGLNAIRGSYNFQPQYPMANYTGNMTDPGPGIFRARYPFSIKNEGGSDCYTDESGNKYFEFNIRLNAFLAKEGDRFSVTLESFVDSHGIETLVYTRQDGNSDGGIVRPTKIESVPGYIYVGVNRPVVPPVLSVAAFTGRAGESVRVQPQLIQGNEGGRWSATGLPAGLSINPTTGVISGTPTAAGSGSFTVTYTDLDGMSGSAQARYNVLKAGANTPEAYVENMKLGAYEGKFTVFDVEAAEESAYAVEDLELAPAPDGYGYYRANMKVRLTYGNIDGSPEMFPSSGVIILAIGSTEDGAVYPSAAQLADSRYVSMRSGKTEWTFQAGITNFSGSMTMESGVLKARYPFSIRSGTVYTGVDEKGNRYGEFNISLRGLLAKPDTSFSVSVYDWYSSDGRGSIVYTPSTSSRMTTVCNVSGTVSVPGRIVSFTKDNVETDAIKILRWKGMDAASTGEPSNRGYDPTASSATVGVRLNGKPMAYNAANLAKAKELFKDSITYEQYTRDGFVRHSVTEGAGGTLAVSDRLSISFGSDASGNLTATVSVLNPVAMRLTMVDGSECLIATPGDINLDGEMNANDWGTIMRVLAEAPSEYDVTDYPGVTINGRKVDLWALLADMTSDKTSGERGDLVDGNDWATIMYLTAEAWK